MGEKGDITKKIIQKATWNLLCEKGYKACTMKDICESTGLSRGGLYRHYGSVAEIFSQILESFASSLDKEWQVQMKNEISAVEILEATLKQMKLEMCDSKHTLSLAIYEFAEEQNNKLPKQGAQHMETMFLHAGNTWETLIRYGIERKEFQEVEVEEVVDLILFSYQGVRMWGRIIGDKEEVAEHLVSQIRKILVKSTK